MISIQKYNQILIHVDLKSQRINVNKHSFLKQFYENRFHCRPLAKQQSRELAKIQEFIKENDIQEDLDNLLINNNETKAMYEVDAENVQEQKRIKLLKKGFCYGCGFPLQIMDEKSLGYIEPSKYERKKVHKQLDQLLCSRCQRLNQGELIPAVKDGTYKLEQISQNLEQYKTQEQSKAIYQQQLKEYTSQLQKSVITQDELRESLKGMNLKRAIIVMVIDILDVNGSFISNIRNIVGKCPIIVLASKVDLLPKGTDYNKIKDWLNDILFQKSLTVIDIILVSSKNDYNIKKAVGTLLSQRDGRNIYVLGSANVGKSKFIRALLKEMRNYDSNNFDPGAAANGRFLPTESAIPGTTLGIIPLSVFSSGGILYDTPGVHTHHRVIHSLSVNDLMVLNPTRRITAYFPPTPFDLTFMQLEEEYKQLVEQQQLAKQQQLANNQYSSQKQEKIDIYNDDNTNNMKFYLDHDSKEDLETDEKYINQDGLVADDFEDLDDDIDQTVDKYEEEEEEQDDQGQDEEEEEEQEEETEMSSLLSYIDQVDEKDIKILEDASSEQSPNDQNQVSPNIAKSHVKQDQEQQAYTSQVHDDQKHEAYSLQNELGYIDNIEQLHKKVPYGKATYLWGGVARLDFIQCPKDVQISFHGPNTLRILPLPYTDDTISPQQILEQLDIEYESQYENTQEPNSHLKEDEKVNIQQNLINQALVGYKSVEVNGGGLTPQDKLINIDCIEKKGVVCDLCVSGLPGWVTFHSQGLTGLIRLRIWVPKGILVYLRQSMPIQHQMQES